MLKDVSVTVHQTAIVAEGARLGPGTVVGPYCVIGRLVELGPECVLHNNVTITGRTRIGDQCQFYPYSVIGAPPQDLKYRGEETELVIGHRNVFREHATAHPGTHGGGGVTRVGDDNLFMAGVHVGHDVMIAHHCVLANLCLLAGHVVIEDYVWIGGHVGVHHFVTIGKHAMIAGMTKIASDVPPFMTVAGTRTSRQETRAVNGVGLKRRGFTEEQILRLKQAYMRLFSRRARASGVPIIQTIAELRATSDDENVLYLCDFLLRSFECGRKGRYLESLRSNNKSASRQE